MSEVELLAQPFISKVKIKAVQINHVDYEESQRGVMREMWRIKRAKKKAFDPVALEKMEAQIAQLENIFDDLQQALEK